MSDTLKIPFAEIAHLGEDEIDEIRRDLFPTSFPTLRRVTPWALGLLAIGVAGVLAKRRFFKA